MPRPPYRTLRIVLRVFSFLVAFGSLLMIFAGKPLILRIFLRPPEGEVSTLLLFLLKEIGGFALMLSLLLWFAARDPVRNVAILDAVIAGLCILSITPFVSLWMTDIRTIYPAYLVWGRSVVRLAIALVLYWLGHGRGSGCPRGIFEESGLEGQGRCRGPLRFDQAQNKRKR